MITAPSLSHEDHLTIDILFDEIVLSLLQLFGIDYGVTDILTIEWGLIFAWFSDNREFNPTQQIDEYSLAC